MTEALPALAPGAAPAPVTISADPTVADEAVHFCRRVVHRLGQMRQQIRVMRDAKFDTVRVAVAECAAEDIDRLVALAADFERTANTIAAVEIPPSLALLVLQICRDIEDTSKSHALVSAAANIRPQLRAILQKKGVIR